MDVAIIGAGMAGLAAARRLAETQPDLAVTIFESATNVGGRALTRHVHDTVIDHGAQYLKTPTPELHHYITTTLGAAGPLDIGRDVWVFDAAGTITPGDPEQNAGAKWAYANGLQCLPQAMAEGLTIQLSTPVERIKADPAGGFDIYAGSEPIAHARAVLFTPPAPATLSLVAASPPLPQHKQIIQELSQSQYRSCISVALGYRKMPPSQPFYALVNTDRGHPISWIAYEHMKPERAMGNQGVLLAQMAPDWSAGHCTEPHKLIGGDVAHLAAALLGKELRRPDWFDCYIWRNALPNAGCDISKLEGNGLFFAGDYLGGQGRLHLAIESGWAAAARIGAWNTA